MVDLTGRTHFERKCDSVSSRNEMAQHRRLPQSLWRASVFEGLTPSYDYCGVD
jgi:hypothetical protein